MGPKAGRLSLVPATVAVWKKCGNTWGNGDKRMPKSQVLGRCVTLFHEQRGSSWGVGGFWTRALPLPQPRSLCPSPMGERVDSARTPESSPLGEPSAVW